MVTRSTICAAATLLGMTELALADAVSDEPPESWWVDPQRRISLIANAFHEQARAFSTAVRPRDLTGSIAVTCEHREGRPCGDVDAYGEIDAGGGYARLVGIEVRLRAQLGNTSYAVDRLYLHGEYGPVAAQVGRDVISIGPRARTQLAWGDNAPPLNHIRLSTSRPLRVTDDVRANAHYIVGTLRDPQTYAGTVVTIARGQLDFGRTIELGVIQMLQLGGDGAAAMGLWDFLAEHVRRRDSSASGRDSSNRRFGGDVAMRIPALRSRLYYAIMFEDIRKARFIDAVRYDADHLMGLEIERIDGEHTLTIEWHQTGARSQEHTPRVTGFTNAGYLVGSPLGPDAQSIYAGANIKIPRGTVQPWFEVAAVSSATYTFIVDGPISPASLGEDEARYRLGTRGHITLTPSFSLQGEVMFEHVDDFGFESRARRNNGGISLGLVWQPHQRIDMVGDE